MSSDETPDVEDIYPLTPMQQGMLFHTLLQPGSRAYFEQVGLDLDGPVDAAAFEDAWARVVERHGVLRTAFLWEGLDEPVQVVHRRARLPLARVDLRGLSPDEQRARIERHRAEDRARGFDLAQAPLMRLALFRLDESRHHLVWSFHHLLLDGWSSPQVLAEALGFHEARLDGRDHRPPRPPPYSEYVAWLQSQDLAKAEAHWRETLRGFTAPTPLVVDRPGATTSPGDEPAEETVRLPEHVTAALQAQARRHRVTLNTMVQAAWGILLSRYNGGDGDVVFGATVSGRPPELPGVERMVGLFINTIPVRVKVDEDAPVADLLAALQAQQAESRQYEHAPLAQVQKWSGVPAGTPLFESILVFENMPPASGSGGSGGRLRVRHAGSWARTNYPLTVVAMPGDSLVVRLVHEPSRFEPGAIARMAGHLGRILGAMAADGARPLRDLPLLTEEERHETVVAWNDVRDPAYRPEVAHHAFEEQAARHPERAALRFQGREMTYAELDARADALARRLRGAGVGRGTIVGVALDRSFDLVVGILGVMKAGGAYLPLDPAYPRERLAFMLEDSAAAVLLTQERLRASLPAHPATLLVDAAEVDAPSAVAPRPDADVAPTDPIYVIYTSGSTGRPKGVLGHHAGACNMARALAPRLGVAPGARVLQFAALSFDAAAAEIFIALLSGATLVLAPRDDLLPGPGLVRLLREEAVTAVILPPSALASLPEADLPALRTIVVAGEACPPNLVERWGPGRRFVNGYGPTEASVCATTAECAADGRPPPIGRPIPNVRVHLVDARLRPLPVGVPGELLVGGAGVALGYLHRPDLTAEKFVPDPFSGEPGARLYRTGDLARFRPDGEIEFLGRIDHQVKIRGFRIELGEIEAALLAHPDVNEAVVLAREDAPGQKRLVAYLVPAHGRSPTVADLRAFLGRTLPEHFLPAAFVALPAFPLTPNGKVDRKALPDPDAGRPDLGTAYAAPRTPAEEALAAIWSEVLRVERVGVHDNFFALGGDSILSIQVVARAHERGLRLTPKLLFDHPTVAGLAAVAGADARVETDQGAVEGSAPPTPIQRWFFDLGSPAPDLFNQSTLFDVPADLDPALVQRALAAIVEHHDALRMRVRAGADGWAQEHAPLADAPPAPPAVVDLSAVPDDGLRDALAREADKVQASMRLDEPPLVRAGLFRLGPGRGARLLVAVHHMAVDAVSWRVLAEDLETAYAQLARGETPSLPPKTTSFQEWARRLEALGRDPSALAQERAHWLRDPPPGAGEIPLDREGGRPTQGAAHTVWRSLDEEETRALLRELPRAYRTQANDALLAALAEGLRGWTGRDAHLVALEGHGREDVFEDADLTRTVGWFTSLFPVLLELPAARDPAASLKAIKEQLRAIPRKGVGYGILRHLADEDARRRLAAQPKPQVSFNYLGQIASSSSSSASDAARRFRLAAGDPKGREVAPDTPRAHLLEVNGAVVDGRLGLAFAYSPDHHERATIEALADGVAAALRALAAHASRPDAGGFTPSDFPLARLGQDALDELARRHGPRVADVYPATPMQRGMIFHALDAPGSGLYVEQAAFDLEGDLDADALERAWRDVAQRHAVLRTAFAWDLSEVPLQVVMERVDLPFDRVDWSGLAPEEQARRFEETLAADRARGFDLARAPAMRVALFRLGERRHRLAWTFHHLLLDGWSTPILLAEVFDLLDAHSTGRAPALPEPEPFSRYVAWLCAQDAAAAESHWRRTLAGFAEPTPLPFARPSSGAPAGEQGDLTRALSAEATAALNAMARSRGLTLNTLVQGAWALLLGRAAGARDVVFGTTVSGRPTDLPGVERMVGMFLNALPVRVDLPPDAPVAAWLARLQAGQAEQRQFEATPLTDVQRASGVPRGTPLFESLVVFENYPLDALAKPDLRRGLAVRGLGARERTNYPLTLVVHPGERLALRAYHDRARFPGDAAERLLATLAHALEELARRPDAPLSSVVLATGEERERVLRAWNATDAPLPRAGAVHDAFARRAALQPDAPALEFGAARMTYAELDLAASRLARRLRARGVRPGDLVGLAVERRADMVVATLAILKAGAAYVPLDAAYPRERLALMVGDAGARLVVAHAALAPAMPEGAEVLPLEDELRADDPGGDLPVVDGETPAYAMYTSGSTGTPKGVVVPHRAIVHLAADAGYVDVGPGTRVAQASNVSFDAATFEIWSTLLQGGTVVGIGRDTLLSPAALAATLRDGRVDVMFLTTALFHQLAAHSPATFAGMRAVLVGGDALDAAAAAAVLDAGPPARLLNAYGPTETTTFATWHLVEAARPGVPVPIGRPLAGTRAYVLDVDRQPLPPGLAGELFIGGRGVALGYHRRPELTAERFLPDPFSDEPGARMYRTGDLVRWTPEGRLEYLGRLDQQVKVRGFRIELGEIEAALAGIPGVRQAAAIAREDAPGQKRLVAYVVAPGVAADGLRERLRARLPEYMVPSAVVPLDALPLTPNGKLDRRALPAPEDARPDAQARHVPPRTALEACLAGVWAKVLKAPRVGVHDGFFDLGGDSILAIQAVALAAQAGVPITTRDLFERPTLAALAESVGAGPRGLAVTLAPGGAQAPFFCIHPGGGTVACYVDLARRLGGDRPFVAIQARGVEDDAEPHRRVEEMADAYAREIREIQPHGPYLVGGWSLGAFLALEVARTLRAAGEEVALLALLDPIPGWGKMREEVVEEHAALKEALGAAAVAAASEEGTPQRAEATRDLARLLPKGGLPAALLDVGLPVVARNLRIREAQAEARLSYEARPYEGPALLLMAEDSLRRFAGLEESVRALAPAGTLVTTPGDHQSIVQSPEHAAALAERLRAAMPDAAAAGGAASRARAT